MKRQLPSQILEQQFFSLATRQAPLSESIQLGAQLILQKVVELEVTEFLGRELPALAEVVKAATGGRLVWGMS